MEQCKSVFRLNILVFSNLAGHYEDDHDASKARELEVPIRIKVLMHKIFKALCTEEPHLPPGASCVSKAGPWSFSPGRLTVLLMHKTVGVLEQRKSDRESAQAHKNTKNTKNTRLLSWFTPMFGLRPH